MNRIAYLDGLRGMACLQVVLYHYACTFWPGVPLGYFASADSAVALFFLMSGFVLTGSFEKNSMDVPGNTLRRAVRLVVPAIASVLIAIPCVLAGHANAAHVAQLTGAEGTRVRMASPALAGLFADLTGRSAMLGYAGVSLLPPSWLPPYPTSLNPPLWTLSVEFFGSIWIMILVALRTLSPRLHRLALLVSLPVIGTNVLLLFTVGHLCAVLQGRMQACSRPVLTALPVLGAGLVICGGPVINVRIPWLPAGIFADHMTFSVQIEAGSILIFIGVLMFGALHELLEARPARYLGRLSFSVYLLHGPIMIGAACFIYLVALPLGGHFAAILTFAVGLALTLGLAAWFERYIDLPVIRLSRAIKFSAAIRGARRQGAELAPEAAKLP